MIKFDNNLFIKKFGEKQERKIKVAVNADSSVDTLEKVIAGNTDVTLKSLDKLGEYLGLDIAVQFIDKTGVKA